MRQSDQSWQALTFKDPYPYLRSWRDCYFLHLVLCCKATFLRKHTDLHYYHMVSGYFFFYYVSIDAVLMYVVLCCMRKQSGEERLYYILHHPGQPEQESGGQN